MKEMASIFTVARDWFHLGCKRAREHKWNEAIALYDRALTKHSQYPAAWNNRWVACASKRNNKEAKRCFLAALEIDSKYPYAFYNMGVLFIRLGQRPQAIHAYQLFVKFASGRATKYVNRAKERIAKLEAQNK